MSQTPRTASDLIDSKGGPLAFSQAANLSHGHVRTMKGRNRIPRTAWPEIQKAFEDITLDILLATEQAATQDAA